MAFVCENPTVSNVCSNPHNRDAPETNFTLRSIYLFNKVISLKDIIILAVLLTYASHRCYKGAC